MHKGIAKTWSEALRSGEYRQTTDALHRKDSGFCCLGVLCDIYRRQVDPMAAWVPCDSMILADSGDESPVEIMTFSIPGQGMYPMALPVRVREWAGMHSMRGDIKNPDGGYALQQSLAEMNDGGMTFAEIADVIDQFVEGL